MAADGALSAAVRTTRRGRRHAIAVLDDDPTGSQAVHDVDVVMALEPAEYAEALENETATVFVLTNSRGLLEPDAVAVTAAVADDLLAVADRSGRRLDLVSRSDSTLRGHVHAETRAIDRVRRARTGGGYDAVLFAPAFFEAGRYTRDDVHWVAGASGPVPVGETEFARDLTFGFRSSDLREFLAETSTGSVRVDDVLSIGLDDIRSGGVPGVSAILERAHDGQFVVVNGEDYSDYDVVALAALTCSSGGRSFLYRTGPSFVRALAGLEGSEPLGHGDIPLSPRGRGNGLIVVGSHTDRTGAQLEQLRATWPGTVVELDARSLATASAAEGEHLVEQLGARAAAALSAGDVLISTSRGVVGGKSAAESLRIAARVADAVADLVRSTLDARPSWIVAKGGITSHVVAVRGLRMRRARVLGQFRRGMISLLEPSSADERAVGIPYVVFPGNVGGPEDLRHVVEMLNGGVG